MVRRWNQVEEKEKRNELHRLYIKENKTIAEIARLLDIAESSVFQRMMRLDIASTPEKKTTYIAKRRTDIVIPSKRSPELAEFFGIMLGDGSLSHYQVVITLGTKELAYAEYICKLMYTLFNVRPKIAIRKNGCKDVYIGSLDLTEWLQREGLVFNKVKYQIDIPRWIFSDRDFMAKALRGLMDTDGSVYMLKFGTQISFCNHSMPLLESVREILVKLHFHPSKITGHNLYLTRKEDIKRYFQEIGFGNKKHERRFLTFFKGASHSGN
ncbi:MAG: LAGLIDADG family homing endonuclease [Candidatus Sungbacteria bacterium]|nr:LAGLIDADG family homing endonuclease [Candidatus Sungbacteria bacterium]